MPHFYFSLIYTQSPNYSANLVMCYNFKREALKLDTKYQKELDEQNKRNIATQKDLENYLVWKHQQHISWSQIY